MLKHILSPLVVWPLLVLISVAAADELHRPSKACCSNCNCEQETCWREVITHVCRMIEVKTPIKKIVYECKEVPYCEHITPKSGDCCCCPQCQACPKYKKVLVKKEIICGEKCETKCVVEEVKQLVPVCNCCGHCTSQAAAPTAPTTPKVAEEDSPSDSPALPALPAARAPKPAATLQTPEFPKPKVDSSTSKSSRGPVTPVVFAAPAIEPKSAAGR